ncbi:MAG TPA: hydantoinase B/oxoprolinase family protein [Chloroflexota bacterium]|nr:hydantoinase B/oxoprolinase family protein [Chloroflexota bacterium]HZU08139.1 hydantoinase B/oxoprolinase family protein [Chloroflexota bacterium]
MATATAPVAQLDPIKFEIFAHRLWEIAEEGRLSLQRVTASPIVAQGGECMSSFYAPDGTMILACSGHLRFAAATSDAIKKLIEWFGKDPGFFDGDQIFQNDPYTAGAHTYDQMVVKPIFYDGELIAWTASSSHTADVGGPLRGGATEIFHEGIRILGLKVVERGQFREDVFRSIVAQCRDPEYVGLDLKSRIAANNVCAARYLQLVEKLGKDFVVAAGQKLIEDAERMARERLRSIPDGTWVARSYGTRPDRKTGTARVYQIVARLTKRGDELEIDFEGSSEQSENDMNSTLPCTVAHVSISLTNSLFWNVPWSDGKLRPVRLKVPEGSILHCRYPAACSHGPRVGTAIVAALNECLAKMLYAAGQYDDVNATWSGHWTAGGPGYFYGGHNREGLPAPQGLYDIHGSGLGAAPTRDGVSCGGHMNIPSGGISDVERIEMQYPFIYFTRNYLPDGGGFGKFQGGAGSHRICLVYGTKDLSAEYKPYGGVPEFAFGLFGGYPVGYGGERLLFETPPDLLARLQREPYPTTVEAIREGGWGVPRVPEGAPPRVALPEHWLVSDFVFSGGGYGDPLDRDPALVARDLRLGLISPRTAYVIYGVVADPTTGAVDVAATEQRRRAIREERLRTAQPGPAAPMPPPAARDWQPVLRFHEYLDLVRAGDEFAVRCRRCQRLLCRGDENYKAHVLQRTRDLAEFSGRQLPSGEPYRAVYQEYICPGCATLLCVDVLAPEVSDAAPLWDVQLDLAPFRAGGAR